MKKILGISGSPRKNGNSEYALSRIFSKLENNVSTNVFHASEMDIQLCDGCLLCEENGGKCYKTDDMSILETQLEAADIIVITTPVYFDGVPAILKNILDRMNPLSGRIEGKQAYIITFGQADDSSWERARSFLENFFDIMGIKVIGKKSFHARLKNDAKDNAEIIKGVDEIAIEILNY